MFGNRYGYARPSESFYRNFFALLTFVALGFAFFTQSPAALFAILFFGAISRTSARKGWKNPRFAEKYFPWFYREPQEEADEQEEEKEASKKD